MTTIQVNDNVKHKLDKLKVHPIKTYNELIESLIETIEVLSNPEDMRDIAEALEQYKRGEFVDFEEIEKELNLE